MTWRWFALGLIGFVLLCLIAIALWDRRDKARRNPAHRRRWWPKDVRAVRRHGSKTGTWDEEPAGPTEEEARKVVAALEPVPERPSIYEADLPELVELGVVEVVPADDPADFTEPEEPVPVGRCPTCATPLALDELDEYAPVYEQAGSTPELDFDPSTIGWKREDMLRRVQAYADGATQAKQAKQAGAASYAAGAEQAEVRQ